MTIPWYGFLAIGVVALAIIVPAIKIVWQYERGVHFRLGRLLGERGPGLNIIIPYIDRLRKIDMRVETMMVEPQEVITNDNVTVQVDAVVYYQPIDATKAVIEVRDFDKATGQIALTTLRSVLGQSVLDDLIGHRDRINELLRNVIDSHTEPWGIQVNVVEVKDVLLPENLQRAMARQAEAEREKRAKIIHADGERQAAEGLASAGRELTASPGSLELRYLQTLVEMANERNATIIPIPLDIIRQFSSALKGKDA
jgi:regulator of protease activity HflC (stomatin/prohibitin superfamily)